MNQELRPWQEIQRAHDLLAGIILKEVPHGFSKQDIKQFKQWLSVLCWMLKHDHINSFPENLKKIEDEMRKRGFELPSNSQN